MKIVADNSGETTPFDWYNARLSVNFKVDNLADHANIALNDNIGTVNGSNSLIKKFKSERKEEKFMIAIMQIIV